jgi:hypothetical protein
MTKAVNLATVGSNANSGGTLITSDTAKTATGTSVDFTGIPSWVKRITVMFNGVSTNGTSQPLVRIGSGSVTATGYTSAAGVIFTSVSPAVSINTTGFNIFSAAAIASINLSMTITNISSNIWIAAYAGGDSSSVSALYGGGSVSLGGTLDRVRITTVNGTDAFDAGSINILYE